ncbi:MAG: NEW3 domain-containing protein [Chthoniobacterales bacterium]
MKSPLLTLGLFAVFCLFSVKAAELTPLVLPLGGAAFENWKGLESTAGAATLKCPSEAVFRYPDGPRGAYKHGFRNFNDGTADWHFFYGVQMEVQLADGSPVELISTIFPASKDPGRGWSTLTRLSGPDWHTVTLPWSAFGAPSANRSWLFQVKELKLAVRPVDGKSAGPLQIRHLRVVKAPAVSLESEVLGKAAAAGETATYSVTVGNTSAVPQSVVLSFAPYGWEAFPPSVTPSALDLAPGETRKLEVRVQVPSNAPAGGHEKQVLQAVGNGDAAARSELTFITSSRVAYPNILHTKERWDEVRAKVKNYPWAKQAQDEMVAKAEKWQVPDVAPAPGNDPDDTMGPFLFKTSVEHDMMACGVSWQLTGNRVYAEKIARFLRNLSNPANGYPTTLRGCNQALVQEGHFFQHIAMAYDMVHESGVFSEADHQQIEATFRIFMETMNLASLNGSINNWNLSEVTGALYCALTLQDFSLAERFFSGPAGVCDQLSKGTMDDGWWYECSISYNVWCASEFSQVALALQPWGINFKDMWLPASYLPSVMLNAELNGGAKPAAGAGQPPNRPFGMTPELWGPNTRPYRKITDLWNSLLPYLDYRGVMFGVNDSSENLVATPRAEVGGQPFELAYYLFRDPAYAAIARLSAKRDLLYGVPQLPDKTTERFLNSASADNVGLVMLRSQTPDRPIREQIQAVLHYGIHGWAHGHFDRTSLLSLMRYGRSFYNPEMIWYGYEPFMYKFYVQNSVAHNMVVVDQKNQEASPGERTLFHTGKMMQTTSVETVSRWSNPPYGGMVYDYVPVKTFEEKTWREGRFVPIPENPPTYGTLTDFTEPILQRRLMVVTDDYVVLADYLKSEQPHTFESLYQMKGFLGLDAPDKTPLRHDAQWTSNPLSSAQFVTDADWFSVTAPAISRFEIRFGPGADNTGTRAENSEPGVLQLDVHSLWPQKQEIMVATAPEDHAVEKRLFYTVRGDGKTLAEGKFGAWILGQSEIDVPLDGLKQLELETRTELAKMPTLFWANARIVTRDGKEIPVRQLSAQSENVVAPKAPGQDYFGGPIKIAGVPFTEATAAEPQDAKKSAFVRVDLSQVQAVRFKATLGGDYPLGDESQRRKTYAIKAPGGKTKEARFLTIIEPHENQSVIQSAQATDADHIRVQLTDGRVQEITLKSFTGPKNEPAVEITETKNGTAIRSETTLQPAP